MRSSDFREPLPARSILVATDLSARENMALQRAWQLAQAHRAAVKLMYIPPPGQPAAANAGHRLSNVARQLEESLGVPVGTVPVRTHKLEDLAAEAQGMDLVVLPHRQERSTAAFFRGQPVLRLLRSIACPVLVTRGMPGEHYRRILVAVDFSRESQALVKLAADLDARAELEIFHAIGTREEARLRSAEATEQAIRDYREHCVKHARDRLVALTDAFGARRYRFLTVLGRGDPGRQTVVQQKLSGAELVVLGKRRSSAWGDFFSGSVAHRVLSWGSSDVLVVPETGVEPTAPVAVRRMQGALVLPPGAGTTS